MEEIIKSASQSAAFDILPEERPALERRLRGMLEYIQVLEEVTPDDTLVWADGFAQTLREDEVLPSADRRELLQNAAETGDGMFITREKRA